MKKRMSKSMSKNNAKPLTADEKTILSDSAHIPDRDQIFGISHKQYPAPDPSVSEWEGDHEDQVKGERDFKHDTVYELESVSMISDGYIERQTSASTPTTVYPTDEHDVFFNLEDEELQERASALSIAGRTQMTRPELINALRAAIGHH